MNIPEDIIINILKFSWVNDRSSFENLAMTCKQIRRITRDRLLVGCFKCLQCDTIEMSIKGDHLTCFKWYYNKINNPNLEQLCMDACHSGSIILVKYLVEIGAKIHVLDAVGSSTVNGYRDVAKFLTENQEKIDIGSRGYPLYVKGYAAEQAFDKRYREGVELLLEEYRKKPTITNDEPCNTDDEPCNTDDKIEISYVYMSPCQRRIYAEVGRRIYTEKFKDELGRQN